MKAVNTKQLKRFVFETTRTGYGNPDVVIEKAADKANVLCYENGDWRMQDTFYGGHPYAGQEIIYYQGQAVWGLHYRGWVLGKATQPQAVYQFLKEALLVAPEAYPYRGPVEYQNNDNPGYIYTNKWEGDITNFEGSERIVDGAALVELSPAGESAQDGTIYRGLYFGGLVDQ